MRLTVAGPSDQATTLSDAVSVRGTVWPGNATVMVRGQTASVRQGSFVARVALAPGTNVIDVLAGAPGAPVAVSAVRVYRELPVALPDLTGQDPSSAVAQLRRLGLRADVVDDGGFLQSLIPAAKQVCSSSPAAGASLAPGSAVQLQVSKVC